MAIANVIGMYLSTSLSTTFHRSDAAGDCTGEVSSCAAAYYSVNERPAPAKCSKKNKCADLTGDKLEKCLKKWGNCVKKTFRKLHGKV